MKIYISSSWKNREKVRLTSLVLRNNGHEVYDFTDTSCRKSPEIPPERFPEEFDPAVHVYSEYIQREEWRAAVMENKSAIEWADLIILMLPCGNDSHADWAYGVGFGKKTIVVGHPRKGDRSPVHMWANAFADNERQLYEFVNSFNNSKV